MISSRLFVLIILLQFMSCGMPTVTKSSVKIPTNSPTNGTSLPLMTGDNVLSLTVNGANCASNTYLNKPCVSIQVCEPGNTANCQTINDILLDTGSYGLRLFKSVLNSSVANTLTSIASGTGTLAECIQYGDGSQNWGPVKIASLILGNEPAVQVSIQLLDATFGSLPSVCSSPDTSPASAYYNGILGVGLFAEDCGTTCKNQANNNMYFSCNGTTCTGATATIANQVTNPVALLPLDNNGVSLRLPSVPLGGAASASGYLVLGIGTRTNNTPAGVTKYQADSAGEFTTTFNGTSYSSFIDSGSNGLYFPSPSSSTLPDCGGSATGFFCPTSTKSFTATTVGSTGSPSTSIPFQVGNLITLANSGNSVFMEVGGSASGVFDWGLPFHLGRNVYVGIENKSSTLGTGPYWAY